jgi:N-methylhydantoinase B
MPYDPIALGIHWDRLICIADEIVTSLVRTSFSINVRESYDLSCVLFDAKGRSLAQGTYSVPSFIGTAQETLRQVLQVIRAETLRPGDILMTNDPWIGTGHLFDINVMQPIFRREKLVGYAMSITHLPDIGGGGFSAMAHEIYEEGLRIPPVRLMRDGKVDPFLIDLLAANVRVPEQTIGDIMANATCTTVGARKVNEFMADYELTDLAALSDAILDFSDRRAREELLRIPAGSYRNAILVEGVDEPIRLECRIDIADGEALIDFSGTSQAVTTAINVPICYSRAMAWHAIKCLTTPRIPNNQGAIRPIRVEAPAGCILNAGPPFPTGGRHVTGHFVQPLIFGALAAALPDRVQADSGMLNLINVQGINRRGEGVSSIFFASGGFGALRGVDGADTTPSPSNMTGTPIEVWEDLTGTLIHSKRLLTDSGGPGKFRGGLGQRIEIINDSTQEMSISCLAGRTEFPPAGVLGGRPGARRQILLNDVPVHPKGRYKLRPGDRIVACEAGGGGYGNSMVRDRAAIQRDLSAGFISAEGARRDYGFYPEEPGGGAHVGEGRGMGVVKLSR